MRIQLLSDLHLEANPDYQAHPAPDADVLVLAGDIGSYQCRRDGTIMTEPDWGLRRFSPSPDHGRWPVPVLFVPGNHEYDARDVDDTRTRLQTTCEKLGITWLEQATVDLHGVRFVGTTLWSDYDALPLTPRDKAFRAANHYLHRMDARRHGAVFDAAAMRTMGLACQTWLIRELSIPFDGPTVVVTHFAPSLLSADPRYGLTPGTAGFCNALDPLLASASLWLHGHVHCQHDYVSQGCRVVANPLGYADKGEQLGFKGSLCVDVPGT